jgi:uncharacterized protein YndB with AHSA1/START domain
MATSKQIDEAARKAIFKVFINGTCEQVFHEITKTDEIQKSFFFNRLHAPSLEAGAPMSMRSPNGKFTAVVGKILEYDPPNRFSHTMRFTAYDDPECTVIYDIVEKDGGAEFTLTVENMPMGTKTAKNMASGGTMICNNLKKIIETGQPGFGYRMLGVLFKLMAPLSPKKCKTENWV